MRVFVDEGEPMREALTALLRANDGAHPAGMQPSHAAYLAHCARVLGAFAGREVAAPTQPGRPAGGAAPQPLAEPLTARELEVLQLIVEGASNSEIAERLVIAVGTVKRHINSLFGKLEVASRTQAIRVARVRGLI